MPLDPDVTLLDRWRGLSTKKAVPFQASLELTNRCNERCTHCYIPDFSDDKNRLLDMKGWHKVLQELRDGGVLYLILMGGEPLLSPDFWGIAEKATEMNFHVSIISNGLRINSPQVAKRLKAAGVKLATISLYSIDPKIHDKMTSVPGSHRRTIQAIEYCLAEGIDVSVNSLLTQENHERIFELFEWGALKGVEVKVDPHVTPKLDGDMDPTKLRLSSEQLKRFFEKRAAKWPQTLPKPAPVEQKDLVCNVARGKCAVTSYGELLGCIEVRESMGNLLEKPFAELWNGEVANRWRSMIHKDLNVNESDLGFCEHCPGMAKNEHGDEKKLTDYSVVISDAKKDIFENAQV